MGAGHGRWSWGGQWVVARAERGCSGPHEVVVGYVQLFDWLDVEVWQRFVCNYLLGRKMACFHRLVGAGRRRLHFGGVVCHVFQVGIIGHLFLGLLGLKLPFLESVLRWWWTSSTNRGVYGAPKKVADASLFANFVKLDWDVMGVVEDWLACGGCILDTSSWSLIGVA